MGRVVSATIQSSLLTTSRRVALVVAVAPRPRRRAPHATFFLELQDRLDPALGSVSAHANFRPVVIRFQPKAY